MASAATFYDQLAADYDGLTHTSKRSAVACDFVRELHVRAPFSSALDAACGTGIFTRPLAEFAPRVCGADLSAEMLRQAEYESRDIAADIQWTEAPMQDLPEVLDDPFDLILCMGNSLPHLLTRAELQKTIRGFAQLLTTHGTLVLHQLNYDRLLARGERLVGATRSENTSYVRFYDLQGEQIIFNVIATQWFDDGKSQSQWHSTALRPHRTAELIDALQNAGFDPVEPYGDLAFSPYDPAESNLLVLQATRRETPSCGA